MESTVWGEDWSWIADDLAARIENAPENTIVLVAEARAEVVCAAWLVFKDGVDSAASGVAQRSACLSTEVFQVCRWP
jgi:hypothetical protein